ncbi:MAG: hypothetical protein IAE80_11815, partial [Anaerolinea sp.]|nr:hypothetical protein [Anaerolinea sp.]
NGRRAMMEGSTLFFTLLAVLAAVWLLQRRQVWVAVLLGAAAGLALASKHSAILTVAALFGACALYPLILWVEGKWGLFSRLTYAHPTESLRREENVLKQAGRLYGLLILAGMLAALVFYALNPAWWGDPISRAGDVLELREALLEGQTNAFGGYPDAGAALAGFWRQAFTATPQYYEVEGWGGYLAEQIAAYEASIWRGVGLPALILVPLVIIGVIMLVRTTSRQTPRPLRLLIGVWALAMLLTVLLLTPLEWQRYYLPVYPPILLLAGMGFSGALHWIRERA